MSVKLSAVPSPKLNLGTSQSSGLSLHKPSNALLLSSCSNTSPQDKANFSARPAMLLSSSCKYRESHSAKSSADFGFSRFKTEFKSIFFVFLTLAEVQEIKTGYKRSSEIFSIRTGANRSIRGLSPSPSRGIRFSARSRKSFSVQPSLSKSSTHAFLSPGLFAIYSASKIYSFAASLLSK